MNQALTANGAETLATSFNANVDLFSMIGSARNNVRDAVRLFKEAYAENPATALRILLWARDCRGGAGERKVFHEIMREMVDFDKRAVTSIILSGKLAELGRFDDFVPFLTDERIPVATRMVVASQFRLAMETGAKNAGLIAKWMPRKGKEASIIRGLMKLEPKAYRKLLVTMTDVVETPMCSKDWNSINFSHVPSVAMARYQKAFGRNAGENFTKYKEDLVSGEVEAKAGVLFPYEIIRSLRGGGDKVVSDAQWKALPNYLEGACKILPIIDVSSSMDQAASGKISCMDVAISLGIYLSERQEGLFKNMALTFETRPQLFTIPEGDIQSRYDFVRFQSWGGSTNLQASFELILKTAEENEIPPSEMPDYLIIVSDMEFDEATDARWGSVTNWEAINQKYAESRYKRPNIIFWQVNARAKNVQTVADENGTAMVSGFSPAVMKAVLNNKQITPVDVMHEAIGSARYDIVGLTTNLGE